MAKLLGLQSFFMTLSCPYLGWNELVSIISNRLLNLTQEYM